MNVEPDVEDSGLTCPFFGIEGEKLPTFGKSSNSGKLEEVKEEDIDAECEGGTLQKSQDVQTAIDSFTLHGKKKKTRLHRGAHRLMKQKSHHACKADRH